MTVPRTASRADGSPPRVAFATYHPGVAITDDDALLAEALRQRGIAVAAHPWDSAADWSAFDAVVIRSTWDFHRRPQEFRQWIARVDAAGVRLVNRAEILRWNIDKRYLEQLRLAGISVIPTRWVHAAPGDAAPQLQEILAMEGWNDGAVIKPCISASALDTWLSDGASPPDAQRRFEATVGRAPHGVMIQPFLHTIRTEGEWSLVLVGGEFAHAVVKRPADGDFRVQRDYGGSVAPAVPPSALIEEAQRSVQAAAASIGVAVSDITYARVDGVEIDSRLQLMELEMIEPVLFFAACQETAARVADAIARALRI